MNKKKKKLFCYFEARRNATSEKRDFLHNFEKAKKEDSFFCLKKISVADLQLNKRNQMRRKKNVKHIKLICFMGFLIFHNDDLDFSVDFFYVTTGLDFSSCK